jgi:DnaD/phage-associated family protein
VSNLLLNDKPLIILPSLAKKIGLNESIVLQQLHYWLNESNNIRDDFKWVYNTYEDWNKQFPFWSISTIRRIITKLEKANLIIIGNYNKMKIDNTKWYRINYPLLEDMSRLPVQNEQTECSDWTEEQFKLNKPITRDYYREEEEEEEVQPVEVNPIHFFEHNGFGTIGSYIAQKIYAWCDDLSPELVLEAMKIAVERGAKSWSYVEQILKGWAEKKYKTVEQVHAAVMEFKDKRASPKSGTTKKKLRKEDFNLDDE